MVNEKRTKNNSANPLPKICNTLNRKMESRFLKIFYNRVFDECPKICKTLNYYGDAEVSPAIHNEPKTVGFSFWFLDDEIKVEKEYFILDLNGLVGFVGGTLGLFVGFSFFDILKQCLMVFRHYLCRLTI